LQEQVFFNYLMNKEIKTVAIIVAHPDDETLWAGGTILSNPEWQCFIVSLCRKSDPDRAPKFEKALEVLGADGAMGDLDDGPEQIPLPETEVQEAILSLLPAVQFDLVITHSINGEYTRHLRHEEIGRAVIKLWHTGKLITGELRTFAFEDHQKRHFPVAIKNAPVFYPLPLEFWEKKYNIITNIYGFNTNSWEAQITPKEEAFWQFFNADHAYRWLVDGSTTL
jgi:LmbE family N-acetylglucosaminyl deacetylase